MVIRVCVLISSYEGSDSDLKEYEGSFIQSPQHYFTKEDSDYTFECHAIRKATSYRQIRALVKSNQFDVFYNQCDGARDEDRAGEDVIRALEEFQVPFTASLSHCYEISKPDMKCTAHFAKIRTAPFAVLENGMDVTVACAHLKFPVIVKHVCGYSSVGMTKDCKCTTMDQLVNRVERFIKEYQFAMVEEFIPGDEVTVLACADSSQPDGVRVFHPVMVNFPKGEDFKHFYLKWAAFDGMAWVLVPEDDPALAQILDVGRRTFKEMMGGVGYGRCDLRINRETNDVVFLEINPNCGVMYPPDQEGSADWILKLTGFGQKEFAKLQIREALLRFEKERPVSRRCFDAQRGFHLRAVRRIKAGFVVFADEGRPFRLCTKPFVEKNWREDQKEQFRAGAWPIGSEGHYYALWDHSPAFWRVFNHSCEPNMAFGSDKSLNVVTLRDVEVDEELTMDYRTFIDDNMKPFWCYCGAAKCEGLIAPKQPRTTPLKSARPEDDYRGELHCN